MSEIKGHTLANFGALATCRQAIPCRYVNSNRRVQGRMKRVSWRTTCPSSTRTRPTAQALSGSQFAVSKSIAVNVGGFGAGRDE